MVHPELHSILCCPETHQSLALADAAVIASINQKIARGEARNRGGNLVKEPIEGGLMRADQKFLYPIRRDIPILLIDEAIALEF